MEHEPTIEAVDLFCGAGGLTAGLRKAGVRVKAGYDIDSACKYAYEYNNKAKFQHVDVTHAKAAEINQWYSGSSSTVRLLAGCAPCQPFSTYNQGKDTSKDRKWPLLYAFARLIEETEPDLVTMENVPDVTKHDVYHDFVKKLQDLNYHIWASRVDCVEYGLAQRRRRHVLLASKLGPIALMQPTHKNKYRKVEDVIGKDKLSRIDAGEVDPKDPLHRSASLSPLNLKRIQHSTPGGTWKSWPKELVADCHTKESGATYPSVYGRMRWDAPSPTMTTLCYGFGNGRFGHPEQDRAISLREAAMLQSFPKSYRFVKPGQALTIRDVGRMIGNAVPVRLGQVIGLSLKQHVRQFGQQLLQQAPVQEQLALE